MVRRSFRIGLRVGLLFGVALALVKTVQSRRTSSAVPPPAPWEPIVDTTRSASAAEPVVDEVGEPIMEPAAPEPDPGTAPSRPTATPPEEDLLHAKVAPADDLAPEVVPEPTAPAEVTAPVKKVAAKKLPAAKKSAAPARKASARKGTAPLPGYVEPEAGACPPTHPVKAKLASRLFHLPGMFAYDRTRPDRCYLDASTAVADGFTQAKR